MVSGPVTCNLGLSTAGDSSRPHDSLAHLSDSSARNLKPSDSPACRACPMTRLLDEEAMWQCCLLSGKTNMVMAD